MNPQPVEQVGQICAILFGLVFCYYFYKSYKDTSMHRTFTSDLFTIGYVEDNPVIKNIVINKESSFESQQLYVDCIDSLYALGFKKSEAKKRAKFIFSTFKPQPSTVQEFLTIALKKPS
jgi:hypothetical protein